MTKQYSLFHLNSSFSSVESTQIKMLIKNCYWPLLDLVEKNNFKIALECSVKTLFDINKIDHLWVNK